MKDLLNGLLENIFIPSTDLPTKLQDIAGAYLIYAKSIDILPKEMKKLWYLYISGKSTLTKSLGVLFNLKKQYESKTRFNYKKVKNIEYNCHESNYKVIICNYGVF